MHTVTDPFVMETSPKLGKLVLPMRQVSLATSPTNERIVLHAGTVQKLFLASTGRLGKAHHLAVLRMTERWAHRCWWLLGSI